jgi:hypothetical protein
VSYAEHDEVRIKPLDGIKGTVVRVREDGRYAVLADCATQATVWLESELEPAGHGWVTPPCAGTATWPGSWKTGPR